MIGTMSAPALQLDPPDPESGGGVPWLVALAALALMLFTLVERLGHIPDALEGRALEAVRAAGIEGLAIDVDGRDVTLAGELAPGIDRAALIARVAATDGVRVVRDELVVIDPVARLRDARTRFRERLAGVDVAALAFEPGSTSLTAAADATLDALVALLNEFPDFRVRIAGHTDDTGRADVNLRLSGERAEAVASRLAARGIDPARLIAKGYGATRPIADNDTGIGRARNRRIEISYVD